MLSAFVSSTAGRSPRPPARPSGWARATLLGALLLALGCFGGEEPFEEDPAPSPARDACSGRCTEAELCVEAAAGVYECARICANQLRCWSGCCLPLAETGYNVCRPRTRCFPAQ